jgi:carbohydrate kinase (thermoresistant glucokinase family)
MGVSGAGKTTIGRALAARLGWQYIEADALHPPSNIAKLRAGTPLTDDDRAPWLDAVRADIDRALAAGADTVVACSALRRAYRERLLRGLPRVAIVWLRASEAVLRSHAAGRTHPFMPTALLDSQLDALEPPEAAGPEARLAFRPWNDEALVVDVTGPIGRTVVSVLDRLGA